MLRTIKAVSALVIHPQPLKEVIAVLLDNGADQAVCDDRGNTALYHLADGLTEVLMGKGVAASDSIVLDRGLEINASDIGYFAHLRPVTRQTATVLNAVTTALEL